MAKIINIHTGEESVHEAPIQEVECTVCKTAFSPEEEGGIMGHFGLIPVQFCPMCLSSCIDMVDMLQDKKEE